MISAYALQYWNLGSNLCQDTICMDFTFFSLYSCGGSLPRSKHIIGSCINWPQYAHTNWLGTHVITFCMPDPGQTIGEGKEKNMAAASAKLSLKAVILKLSLQFGVLLTDIHLNCSITRYALHLYFYSHSHVPYMNWLLANKGRMHRKNH